MSTISGDSEIGVEPAPLLLGLGLVLGRQLEENFRRALIADGDFHHRARRSLESRPARRSQQPADARQILAEMSGNTVGGEKYDREWPERARQTMW
jgi:hypothetical protein